MTTKQEAAIRRHGEQLLAIFPGCAERDPVKLCKKLRTLEKKAARVGLQLCNGPELSLEDADETTDRILARVNALLGNAPGHLQITILLNRDPRGNALKIHHKDMALLGLQLSCDWGGYGIIAPEIDKEGR